jgi:hypothetical protein
MSIQVPGVSRTGKAVASHRLFVAGVFAALGLSIAALAVVLGSLGRLGLLPPPPLAGNVCINEKFKFLAERDIGDTDLMAVGSSVTWRNLDMAAFGRRNLAGRPLNASTCYLQLGQTGFFTDFMLTHLKQVRSVVIVVAPRDFEQCTAAKEKFFSTDLAAAYVFSGMSSFPIYLANFRPASFIKDVIKIRRLRADVSDEHTMTMDAYGTSPVRMSSPWWPRPELQETCFAALSELEQTVAAAGAHLIVASFPLHPEWHELYDPTGAIVAAFEARLQTALVKPSTLFFSAGETAASSWRYADSVHLVWESATAFSDRLAALIAAKRD